MDRLERFQTEIIDDVEIIHLDDSLRNVATRQFSSFIASIEQGDIYDALFALKTARLSTLSGESSDAMNRIEGRLKEVFDLPTLVCESISGMAHLSILLTIHPLMRMESYIDRSTIFLTIKQDYRVYAMSAEIILDQTVMAADFKDVDDEVVAEVHLPALSRDAREGPRAHLYDRVGQAVLSVLWGDSTVPEDVAHIVRDMRE